MDALGGKEREQIAELFRQRFGTELNAIADASPEAAACLRRDRWRYVLDVSIERAALSWRMLDWRELSWALACESGKANGSKEDASRLLQYVFEYVCLQLRVQPDERQERVSSNSLGVHCWPNCPRGQSRYL